MYVCSSGVVRLCVRLYFVVYVREVIRHIWCVHVLVLYPREYGWVRISRQTGVICWIFTFSGCGRRLWRTRSVPRLNLLKTFKREQTADRKKKRSRLISFVGQRNIEKKQKNSIRTLIM